jgi:ribosomal protein S18 acetylase RimI-like enzyme
MKFRRLEKRDVNDVSKLMEIRGPGYPGVLVCNLRSKRLFRAVCEDSLIDSRMVIVICETDGIVGFAICEVDRKAYWKEFPLRHPFLGLYIILHKLHRIKKVISDGAETEWDESSPKIAKIVHVWVDEKCRGMGIGRGLYEYLFSVLDVDRIDAHIVPAYTPGKMLHLATGWKIEDRGSYLYARKNLGTRKEG